MLQSLLSAYAAWDEGIYQLLHHVEKQIMNVLRLILFFSVHQTSCIFI